MLINQLDPMNIFYQLSVWPTRWMIRQFQSQEAADLQEAVTRTYRTFADRYPHWAASLFDEYFLQTAAASLLVSHLQLKTLPPATELAQVWLGHLGPVIPATAIAYQMELIEIAEEFLGLLEDELKQLSLSD